MPGKASELATRSTRRVCLQGEGRDTKGVAHHQLAEKERPGYLIQASLKQFRPPQCRNWDFQMTPETLQSLLQRGETLDVEFKGEEHRPLQDHEFGVAFCQISPTRPNGCSNHWCARASLFSGRPAKRPGMDSARKYGRARITFGRARIWKFAWSTKTSHSKQFRTNGFKRQPRKPIWTWTCYFPKELRCRHSPLNRLCFLRRTQMMN